MNSSKELYILLGEKVESFSQKDTDVYSGALIYPIIFARSESLCGGLYDLLKKETRRQVFLIMFEG